MESADRMLRFQTQPAIAAVAARFSLPYAPEMQDWAWEVADPGRLDEFLQAYDHATLPDDERFVLMEIILQSCEDLDAPLSDEPRWRRVLALLARRFTLHASSVRYWSGGSGPGQDRWRVSSDLLQLIERQGSSHE